MPRTAVRHLRTEPHELYVTGAYLQTGRTKSSGILHFPDCTQSSSSLKLD